MITYIVPYKNCLINERKDLVRPFLKNMQDLMEINGMCTTVICDYGSEDNIKELVDQHDRIHYLYVEPNEGEFLNTSKCFNKATIMTSNPLLAPLGIDLFFGTEVIKHTINFFRALGKIVLRPDLVSYDQEGNITHRSNVPYVLNRDNIISVGGWDERMYNWGKEDDDIILRIRLQLDMIEVLVRGFGYGHAWHERDFSKKEEVSQGHNYKIMLDNKEHDGKNVKNSYWEVNR